MIIRSAKFIISNTQMSKLPKTNLPEFAFIGRSNVGKSSLINMLTNNSKLAKISSSPGKTQTINHFEINENWYLVDLPGIGYAKVSKTLRSKWQGFISNYILKRESLVTLFFLVDSRIKPQKIDIEFINWLGKNGIPFTLVFTKIDKLTKLKIKENISAFNTEILKYWEETPKQFITSSKTKLGRDEILKYVSECMEKTKE